MVSCNKRVQHSNWLAGFATDQTNSSDHKPSFNRKTNSGVRFAYSDAKTTCPFRARTQTPARNFPETKTLFSSCQQVRRVQQCLGQTPSSTHSSRVLCSRYTIASMFLSLTFIPRFINSFFGGRERINQTIFKEKAYCI